MATYEIRVKGTKDVKDAGKAIADSTKKIDEFNKVLKETSKSSKALNKSTRQNKMPSKTKDLNKGLAKTEKQMKALRTLVATDLGFDVLTNEGKKFGRTIEAIGGGGNLEKLQGMFKSFGDGFMNSSKKGAGFFKAMGGGFKSMSKYIKVAMGGIKGLILLLGKVLFPILAIVAAFKLLQRMWQLNVGGMQTQWGKFMGDIKTTIGKFSAEFSKVLRKLSPLFEVLLKPFIMNMKLAWVLVKGIFGAIWEVIKPIFEVFEELGNVLKDIFGVTGEAKIFEGILKTIGFVLKIIGKTLGFILKVGLYPIIKAFRTIREVIDYIKKSPLFEAWLVILKEVKNIFVGLKDTIMGTLQTIWDFIIGIINKIPNVLLPKSLQSLKTLGDKAPASEAGSNSISNIRNINNNQQMTFNTGRATTPDQSAMFAEMLVAQLNR